MYKSYLNNIYKFLEDTPNLDEMHVKKTEKSKKDRRQKVGLYL